MFGVIVQNIKTLQKKGYSFIENSQGDEMLILRGEKFIAILYVNSEGIIECNTPNIKSISQSYLITDLSNNMIILTNG